MILSSISPPLDSSFRIPSTTVKLQHPSKHLLHPQIKSSQQIGFIRKPKGVISSTNNVALHLFTTISKRVVLQNSVVPFAASIAILLWSNPAEAGFLSGFSGLESMPGPELPQIDFLNRFNGSVFTYLYDEFWNKQEILDKYCIRGAEWGVGDCSAEGMTPDEREKFISMLKEKAGVK
ncbi:hypothetical protein TEA_019960 [Camellia sinensis var. sinensis]|uniref:Uncharacterized protein n=1 Tax=Camellia sinensis var. sinensis TaxID=542762 RepID=A0A4S4DZS0_CAMSN|nr:hypothetical protein TEA_019960 [Camellia sinensis var. sinensis]